MKYVNDLIESTINTITYYRVRSSVECPGFMYTICDYKTDNVIPEIDETWKKWEPVTTESGEKHIWVRGKVRTPDETPEGTLLVLDCTRPSINPQTILYIDGHISAGLDRNHARIALEAGREYDIALYIYFDGMTPGDRMIVPCLKYIDMAMEKAYFDMKVAFDAALCFEEGTRERAVPFRYLEQACIMIDKTHLGQKEFFDSVVKADKYLEEEFYNKECGHERTEVCCLGHSHLDIAWRWTIDQTKEKAQRTFGTVLELMKVYPEFRFMMSQPQLYQFVKDEAPEMYEEIKKRVSEGRWEAEGAMWLESDCNIPSGESFVRQLIHGKQFLRDEFGKESRTLWIPDVFGYSAALPQILKKSGVDYFVTGKISWCDVNDTPSDTFYWKGIDGSEVFTYFLTNKDFNIGPWFPEKSHEYVLFNGMLDPREVKSTYDVYRAKMWNDETLHTFGYGDGGGGPTYEMMEQYRRLEKGLPGIPKVKFSLLDEFLDNVKHNFDENSEKLHETPRWDGELYLEYHRGTYTSIAQIKKNNRRAEFALRKAEMLSVLGEKLSDTKYDKESFDRMWGLMNLNQFHDIIPGSAIKEVYDRSQVEYDSIFDRTGEMVNENISSIGKNIKTNGGLLVYNMNSHDGNGIVKYGDKVYTTNEMIPGMGWKVIDGLYDESHADIRWTEEEKYIENRFFRIVFNDMGFMTSIFDKTEMRELLRKGKLGNEIMGYEDYPYHWSAWELSHYTRLKPHKMEKLVSAEPYRNGAAEGLTFTWTILGNTVTQNVVVYDQVGRIDIENVVDMKQLHLLLKALFPFDIRTSKTVSEIQYGHVERPTHMNTSWDEAKFETCMHKWVDVSDNGYGVSILNDCKYGFSSYDDTIAITMVKSSEDPYYGGDVRKHYFTYSIYPHRNNAALGGTIEEAYRLNAPLEAYAVEKNENGTLADAYRPIECDKDNIIFEVMKKAEKSDGTVVRLYDAHNMASKPEIKFNFPVKEAYIVNLLEEEPQKLDVTDGKVRIKVGAFEIVTLLLKN